MLVGLMLNCSSSNDDDNNSDNNTPIDEETCQTPQALSASVSSNLVTISWYDGNGSDLFNIEYGPLGFTLGNGTTINSSETYKDLIGLPSETTYDFYVRANCGGTETSEWAGPHSFVTD